MRVEEFLDHYWADASPSTYNRNLSVVKDFFRWAILRERLHGDPTLAIERARKRDIHREGAYRDARNVPASPDTKEGDGMSEIQPYDSDHTALVHVLWEAQRGGIMISDPDVLAAKIMRSRWIEAVRLHAQPRRESAHEEETG